MAKNKPYMTLETKEDFDKLFDQAEKIGYKDGFKRGIITALSYIVGPTYEIFSSYDFESEEDDDKEEDMSRFTIGRVHYPEDLMSDAIQQYKDRELLRWKQNNEQKEREIQYRVKKILEKESSENPKT